MDFYKFTAIKSAPIPASSKLHHRTSMTKKSESEFKEFYYFLVLLRISFGKKNKIRNFCHY